MDVLLGLGQSNHFRFVVGTDGAQKDYGNLLESATAVTPADVASNHWFHIVALHDLSHGTVACTSMGTWTRKALTFVNPSA